MSIVKYSDLRDPEQFAQFEERINGGLSKVKPSCKEHMHISQDLKTLKAFLPFLSGEPMTFEQLQAMYYEYKLREAAINLASNIEWYLDEIDRKFE